MTLGLLEWQARLACLTFFKAAQLVAGYHGVDEGPLNAWASAAPAEWFPPVDDGGSESPSPV